MKVKELIMRLLDEPMDAEVRLCTDYDKEEVEDYGDVKVVNRGVVFGIDEVEHWNGCVLFNFTDWREDEPQKKYPTEWCEQCTRWEDNKCLGVAHCKRNIEALKHAMSDDLISRAEAIEVIELVEWYHQNKNKDMVSGANDDKHQAWYKAADVYRALEAVPPADRPKGEWVSRSGCYGVAYCSECNYELRVNNTNFCPNCGADMRGEDE